MLLALITATIIGIALAGYLWLVSDHDFATTRSLAWNAAMPVAEAGVDEALTQLYYAGVTNLSANSWTSAGTGWFYKERYVDSGSYYQVAIQQADPPVIVSTGYVPAPRSSASYVKRRVRVNTQRQWLFGKGVAAKGAVDLAGNDLSTDSFDSSDSLFSTNGKYDSAKALDHGDAGTNSELINSLSGGNANIKGRISTGPGGTMAIGANGSVGDRAWVESGTPGIKPGWSSDDMHVEIQDVSEPFTSGYSTPGSGTDNGTNYTWVLDTGNYRLSGFGGQVLVKGNSVLWVTDSVNFDTSDYIYIAPGATLAIYVSAPTATFGRVYNSDGFALSFQYFGLPSNSAVELKANASYVATLYAPEAAFTLGGGDTNDYDFVGACVVNTVKLNGHYHFHFDEALRKTGAPSRGYVVSGWSEVDPNGP